MAMKVAVRAKSALTAAKVVVKVALRVKSALTARTELMLGSLQYLLSLH
ncbi:hypothetical protein I6N90_02375 [Paenibacillus sp. GSMTC-2017]|nr:hypothetical protein [Paenibacillus sp. GSMTC-2017]